MYKIRRAEERGHADHGWLKSAHTFSFADYHDPQHVHFRSLRVINEDRVAPGQGFGKHSHKDMEIVTYVLDGALEHQDSLGNGEVLRPGEFQRMTAGTGLFHSEFNASQTDPVHFYQIWLLPSQKGLEPSYEQKAFPLNFAAEPLRLVASPHATAGSLKIHADAQIFLGRFDADQTREFEVRKGRHLWIQVISGTIEVDGHPLSTSDGVAISEVQHVAIRASEPADIMLFDLS